MKKITQNEFVESLKLHVLYLNGEENGVRMNLEDCDLREIDLSRADLSRADLSGADLSRAYLSGAYLSRAYLSGADLSGAYLPSPTGILLAQWGELSDNLTIHAMNYDAWFHNEPEKFVIWANGGSCPYADSKFQRACNFREKRELFKPSLPLMRGWDLMVAIIREKCANSDFHDKV